MQIALVVDGEGRLLGTLTDGDVRRAARRPQPDAENAPRGDSEPVVGWLAVDEEPDARNNFV